MSATSSSSTRSLRSLLKHDYVALNRIGEVEETPATVRPTKKQKKPSPSKAMKKGGVKVGVKARARSSSSSSSNSSKTTGVKKISAARMKVLHQCA